MLSRELCVCFILVLSILCECIESYEDIINCSLRCKVLIAWLINGVFSVQVRVVGLLIYERQTECFARLSYAPGVHLSVTLVICIKTVQARITKSLLWAAAKDSSLS